jgi:hypothetical protein
MTTMAPPRMPAAAKRVVDFHLKEWRGYRLELHELEADAIFGGYGSDFEARSWSGRPGNPTQTRGLRLADNRRAADLERVIGAIERALIEIAGSDRDRSPCWWALRQVYLGNHARERVAHSFGVSRMTVYRWDRAFRAQVWEQLQGVK